MVIFVLFLILVVLAFLAFKLVDIEALLKSNAPQIDLIANRATRIASNTEAPVRLPIVSSKAKSTKH